MVDLKNLDKWSRANWNTLPQSERDICIKQIHTHVPYATLNTWKAQYQSGEDIGGHLFHFGGGMSVRNLLREVMLDSELPGVLYKEHNEVMHNWDDYYIGALQEALEKWNG
jgi:hypothetical protein